MKTTHLGDEKPSQNANGSQRLTRDTRLVTLGRDKRYAQGVVNTPVFRASTILFDSYEEFRARVADPNGREMYYARRGTPSQWALRDALTDLEGGVDTFLYPSGVAALAGAMLAVLDAGDDILITQNAYEPTHGIGVGLLKRMGISTRFFDPMIGGDIKDLMQPNTKAVLVEAPGSLTFEVCDIPAIAKAAHAASALVIADNTWATPLLCQPLALGADISVQAVTKYIGGHSDLMMGAVSVGKAAHRQLQRATGYLGQTVSPDDAALALRGLRSLGTRLEAHEGAALEIARWLQDQEGVAEVRHPALDTCPGHANWRRDFAGSSGLFSIILDGGDYDDTAALVDGMTYFKMGFSWGGYESLVLPSNPSGVRPITGWDAPGPVLRLHIGLEDIEALKEDLAAGLKRWRER